MRRLVALVCMLTALALTAAPAGALDIKVRNIDSALITKFQYAPRAQAKAMLAGYTVLVKARGFPAKVRKILPFSSVAVLYFGSNGSVLAWSDKSNVVEGGKWALDERDNDVCLYFPIGHGAGACTILFIDDSWIEQSTKGNPFGLKAGAPVPVKMGRFGVSLQKLAAALP